MMGLAERAQRRWRRRHRNIDTFARVVTNRNATRILRIRCRACALAALYIHKRYTHAHRQSRTKRAHAHSRVTPSYISRSVAYIIVTQPSASKVLVKRYCRHTHCLFFFFISHLYRCTSEKKPSKSFIHFRFTETQSGHSSSSRSSYSSDHRQTAHVVAVARESLGLKSKGKRKTKS